MTISVFAEVSGLIQPRIFLNQCFMSLFGEIYRMVTNIASCIFTCVIFMDFFKFSFVTYQPTKFSNKPATPEEIMINVVVRLS